MASFTRSSVEIVGGELVSEYNCVFSFDTKFLYCPSGDVIKVYNTATGRFCGQLEGHKDRITTLIVNERNHLQLISGGLDGYLVIWDIGTDYSAIKTINMNRPFYKIGQLKCFTNSYLLVLNDSSSGRYFVADSNSVMTDNVSMLFDFGYFDAKSVSFGFETNVVAAIDSTRKLVAWSADLSRIVSMNAPTFQMAFTGIAVHPTDRNVIAASTNGGRIYLWVKVFATNDTTAGVPSFYLHWHSNSLRSLAFSAEGTFLFSAGEECVLVKWFWRKQQRTFLPRLGSSVRSIALSPDGAVYALGLVDNTIALVSSNMAIIRSIRGFITGSKIPAVRPKLSHSSETFSPFGLLFDRRSHSLIANSRPGHLQFFDAENNRSLQLVDVTAENYVSGGPKLLPVTEVVNADISSDGLWLATVQSRGDVKNECTLKIWQFDEKSKTFCVNTLSSRAHFGMVVALKFSPVLLASKDVESLNMRLITVSLDGIFRLWHCYRQQPVTSAESQANSTANQTPYRWQNAFSSSYHSFPFFDADWSADGSLVALAAGAYVLLVDGNFNGEDSSPSDDWLLSTLTADSTSRITNVKFGRQEDSSYIVGCSNDNEGLVCVWNLATLQMTWKTTLLLPLIVSNPSSAYMAVVCRAAMQEKKVAFFKPSAPSIDDSFDFTLPSTCSDDLASQISPITSAIFTPKSQQNSDNSLLSQHNFYLLTGDEKLYGVFSTSGDEKTSENASENKFRFSSNSVVSSGSLPLSSLASLLSLGTSFSAQSSVKDNLRSLLPNQGAKSASKFDPLFETPTHLLPPVSRISSEFLLRRCAEFCGVAPNSIIPDKSPVTAISDGDNSMNVDPSPQTSSSSSLLIDQTPSSTTIRSDVDWIRGVM